MKVKHPIVPVKLADLKLDLANPRFVAPNLNTEEDMIRFLYENADLPELLLSFANSGYLDFEPIIVRRSDNVVLEGNRRIAALKLLTKADLAERLEVSVPDNVPTAAKPAEVSAILVDHANEARSYIGFKHINGPKPWDAMSKAKYAADWHATGTPLEEITRALGDTFNTVNRLVHGYRVYEQALREGFDPEKRTARRFAFSHLYTAITRSSIKQWLSLDEDPKHDPVPQDHVDRLRTLMSWLYGQGTKEPAVIRSQNPDLNRLADVVANDATREVLVTTRDLDSAWEELEPPSTRLENALIQAVRQAEAAAALAGSFDGRQSTFDNAERLFGSARSIYVGFRQTQDKLKGLDEV
jgi:hypothetical protein